MPASESLDILWMMLCAALVMLMQAGFCLLESGMTRAKNSINVATKNLVDLCISGLLFWGVGFGLMFGVSWEGWAGGDGFFLSGDQTPHRLAFFLFQLVFCGTATTIISGATAERMHFRGYVAVAVITSGVIYPLYGHWVWGGALGGDSGWLAELGFVDFAGSTVVHGVGGWVALAAIIVLGPRMGRFPKRPSRGGAGAGSRGEKISGHSLHMATVGVFVLWFGWFGFNGGSTLSATDASIPKILVNTNLAAAAGGIASLAWTWIIDRKVVVSQLLVGVVAGLVAITAGCHLMTPLSAILIGAAGAIAACGSVCLFERLRLDDVVGAVPAHAVAGAVGTLAVAGLAPIGSLPAGDRVTQLLVQSVGVGVAFVWAFGLGIVTCYAIHRLMGLRASGRQERVGLNYSEHGASTAMLDLVAQMHKHQRSTRFNRGVRIDRYTEAGQIGAAYNRVLRRIENEIDQRDAAERRYRDIVENALEGIFQTTPDGTFRGANPSLLEIYGDRTMEALTARIKSVAGDLYVEPGKRDEFVKLINAHGTVRDFRAQIRRADGEVIWVSESAREVRDEHGKLQYYEGTVIDITDRVDTERLQRECDLAAAASKAKGQFLARMSHEMRTPLAGVISTLELIDDSTPPPQRDRFIEIAKQSARSLLSLVNDVLDMSKIESGKLELEPVDTDLEKLMGSVIDILYHQARGKGIRLAGHIAADLPPRLWLDDIRVRQILMNLIGNAIKFTSAGEVTVQFKRLPGETAQTTPPGESTPVVLRIEVADTGIGIPADKLDAIFEVFTQADRDTTRRFGGSGLGLAICRQLVELMHGRVGVESTVGAGAVFWLELPAEPVAMRRHVDEQPALPSIQGYPIAVIAPPHSETEFVIRSLESWGLRVDHHDSVERFLAASATTGNTSEPFSHRLPDLTSRAPGLPLGPRNCEAVLVDAEYHPAWSDLTDGLLDSLPPQIWLGCPRDTAPGAITLDRPVQASSLLNAVINRLTPNASEAVRRADAGATLIGDGQRVLVADDNEVNRIVASEMLKRLGFVAVLACDGTEVIDRLRVDPIDIVLIDCEMPLLGGIEATRELRRLHTSGELAVPPGRPLRIIACTAQAMEGDRERCLSVGMDDYLSKPIRREELMAALRGSVNSADPLDYAELLDRCGGDEAVVAEVLNVFAGRCRGDVKSLGEAIHRRSPEIAPIAHYLKGAAATLGASGLSAIAGQIETLASAGLAERFDVFEDSLAKLDAEMDRCVAWIEEQLTRLG